MTAAKVFDLFITHAWRFHGEWTEMSQLLDAYEGAEWRNFSLPWYDPAIDPNTPRGMAHVHAALDVQVRPAQAVIFLAGVYAVKSARRWLDLEVEMARQHGKPIIAVPPQGTTEIADEVRALADHEAGWDAAEIFSLLETP